MNIAYNGDMRLVGAIVTLTLACSASTRELPTDMFAMPANSAPIVLAGTDAGVSVDAGPRSALASARKKKDVVEGASASCPAHARQTAPTDYTLPQTMWTALRNEVYRSNFSPHLDVNNAPDGFTITSIGPCFEEIGLADNDLLRSINGIDFTAGDAYARIWERIQQNGGTAVVHLERGGIIIELQYKVP